MKSRTSSSKAMALGKDLSRFWPVWVGYFLCLVLIQVVSSNSDLTYWYAANMGGSIAVMGAVNCIYAIVTAQALFGDLFNARMCSGLHCLPLKREQWFGIHVRAGLLFSLIPTALLVPFSEGIIYLYSEMVNGWQIPLFWFLGCNLQYIFFFGVAAFAVMCSGSRIAAAVIYGIVNFFSMLAYLLMNYLYVPLLRGVIATSDYFELLSPMYQIVGTRFIDAERMETGRTYLDQQGAEVRESIGQFVVRWESWMYIGVLAVAGLVLLLMARQMYRKRRLECAGDFLAVQWLGPVFQVVFTVLCAATVYAFFLLFFGYYSSNQYWIIGIGLLVGWFAGRMFLERTTRVFRLKNFAGLAVLAGALAASMYITHLDPLGIVEWTPAKDQVTGVTLVLSHHGDFYTEDPEEIEEIIRLHDLAIDGDVAVHPDYADWGGYNPAMEEVPAAYISLNYRMENGTMARREYYILATSEAGAIARKYNSRVEVVVTHSDVQDADDLRREMMKVSEIRAAGYKVEEEYLTDAFRLALAEAIIADCESGALVQSVVYHPEKIIDAEDPYDVHSIYLDMYGDGFFCYLDIYTDCKNVLAVLEETNVMEEFRQENAAIIG